jgi:hypothetical protein
MMGTFHHVSKKYLPLYLNEFAWRHNNRKILTSSAQHWQDAEASELAGASASPDQSTKAIGVCIPKPRTRKEDPPVSLHPMTFEDALKRMLQTPPVNPPKRKTKRRSPKAK